MANLEAKLRPGLGMISSIPKFLFLRSFPRCGGFAVLMFLTVSGQIRAGTINARSAAQLDVTAAVTLAKNGDVVLIPAGTARWSTQFNLTKAITLRGAGIGNTIIYNDRVGGTFINVTTVAGQHTRITEIEFRNGVGTNGGNITNGNFKITSPTKPGGGDFRLDHCKIYGMKGGPCIHTQTVLGVVDHCIISHADGTIGYTYDDAFGGRDFGDGSWAAPSDYGGFLYSFYYEDCVLEQLTGNSAVFFDGTHGGRAVVRHCYFKGGSKAVVSHHGTESRLRSHRHFEWYDCIVENFGSGRPLNQRGGTGVVFNNRFINGPTGVDVVFTLTSDRPADPTYWGRASGKNPWDENDANGGTNANPNTFYTGTCGTGTTQYHIVASGANWRPGQWVGYAVVNTSVANLSATSTENAPGADLSRGSVIIASGTNTLDLEPMIFGSGNVQFAAPNQFKIFRPKNTLDLPGRAGINSTSLVTGTPKEGARLQSTGQPGNNQVSEPWYSWGNKYLKSDRKTVVENDIPFRGSTAYIRQCTGSNNEECHYWNNGAVKPGYPWDANKTATIGPDSSMGVPTMTSQGDTTALYPHPLVTGTTTTSPSPPSNLQVVPGG